MIDRADGKGAADVWAGTGFVAPVAGGAGLDGVGACALSAGPAETAAASVATARTRRISELRHGKGKGTREKGRAPLQHVASPLDITRVAGPWSPESIAT